MLADADRYLAAGQPDPARNGTDYRVGALWLTDAESADFLRDLAAVIQARTANPPGKAAVGGCCTASWYPSLRGRFSRSGPNAAVAAAARPAGREPVMLNVAEARSLAVTEMPGLAAGLIAAN
jgi:hypothetical protein